MLTITRELDWLACHSVYATEEGGAYYDLSGLTLRSQIRQKNAVMTGGYYEHALVMDVDVTPRQYGFDLSLTAAETESLQVGDYLIDVVATTGEIIMQKEPIRVQGYITLPNDPDDVPDFVEIFLTALND